MSDTTMHDRIDHYHSTLRNLAAAVEATDRSGDVVSVATVLGRFIASARAAHDDGAKLMFVGNGGSAGIASHMAIDYSKNGGMRSLAFNDGAALTCLGNDLGYENVFARQIEMHGRPGDVLIAISSSGRSPNILSAVEAARRIGAAFILTLSGFTPDNPLRATGDGNLYAPSDQYGFVEILHLTLCHAALDLSMGWGVPALEAAEPAIQRTEP
ncbi:SIS domain-containing protein [Azospirillum sp. TSO5]|uniref:D-sedoheptulose-7-phosphate isomerase n=1 Tax=Azospirillum sp. TSO5 TaxID=716760 RepID=UPI00200008B1|nr:SIS domain-containing protein [Azospirillum sp. TSO5]